MVRVERVVDLGWDGRLGDLVKRTKMGGWRVDVVKAASAEGGACVT